MSYFNIKLKVFWFVIDPHSYDFVPYIIMTSFVGLHKIGKNIINMKATTIAIIDLALTFVVGKLASFLGSGKKTNALMFFMSGEIYKYSNLLQPMWREWQHICWNVIFFFF